MKFNLLAAAAIVAAFLVTASAVGCTHESRSTGSPVQPQVSETTSAPTPTAPAALHPALAEAASEALVALQSEDGTALAAVAHPDKGVRFSPYAFVDVDKDVRLGVDELKALWSSEKVRTWGSFDGTGDPIEMTGADYASRFVTDRDYTVATSVSVNSDRASGNTTNNAAEAYPKAQRVEYYLESTLVDGQPSNDWRALRLVFETVDGQYYLVGVIHDEWTI